MSKEATANKMGTSTVPSVMLSMGIPMILSMILQACYNIVDSMFVARIPDSGEGINVGEYAVNALTLAFPVAEFVALVAAVLFMLRAGKKIMKSMKEENDKEIIV